MIVTLSSDIYYHDWRTLSVLLTLNTGRSTSTHENDSTTDEGVNMLMVNVVPLIIHSNQSAS